MDCENMSQEKLEPVPSRFRGLRVLLVDNDTDSLLDISKKLESLSYKVTTTELSTAALSVLLERKDGFDLVMADINMPQMDCFKFIKSVQLIKDLPIILMSSKYNKDIIEEAIVKGASFFLVKPIPLTNLKNVWQHVCRESKYKNITGKMSATRKVVDQEVDSKEAKLEKEKKVLEIVDERKSQESESGYIGYSDRIENDHDDKLTTICTKRFISTENDDQGEFKRKKTEDEDNKRLRANRGDGKKLEDKVNEIFEEQSRLCWTSDINLRVKDAKGESEAHQESVLEMMKEPNLARRHYSNHLQKYRVESSSTKLIRATSLPTNRYKILGTSSNSHSYQREFHSVTPSAHHGVSSTKTQVSKRGISVQSGTDLHKEVDGSAESDEIQAVTDSSHLSNTLFEVSSRNKYHNRS